MIKIRYHHLMCIPRYKGEGYSREFCNNLEKIKRELKSNNYILVDSCDDVCKCCPNNKDGRCKDEEKVSKYDALVKERLEKNEAFSPDKICRDCSWFYLCKKINKKY